MKHFLFFYFVTSALFFGLSAAEDSDKENILVRLVTETPLFPLFLDSMKEENAGFDGTYLNQMEKILAFDLDHNGMTKVMVHTKERLAQTAKEKRLDSFQQSAWKELSIHYVVKTKVSDKKLFVAAFNVNNNSIKVLEGLSLSGNVHEDRKQIHNVADAIHAAFFGKKGICSTRILYTLRSKKSGENSEQWETEIWESDYDGANPHQVTKEGGLCVTPLYIPVAKGLRSHNFFYVSYRIGQPKIFIASLKDGMNKRLSYLPGNQLMPAITTRADKIAFISDIAGNPDLSYRGLIPNQDLSANLGKSFQLPKVHKDRPALA